MDFLQIAKQTLYPQVEVVEGQLFTKADVDAAILRQFAFLGQRPYVALWGPCGGSMFRVDMLARLLERNPETTVYNPDKGANWAEYHAYEEMLARNQSLSHLIYLGETRATASTIEAGVHLFYGNSYFVIANVNAGDVIDGQAISEEEAVMLNSLRQIIKSLARIVGKTVFDSLEEAAESLSVDRSELLLNAVQHVNAQRKSGVRTWLKGFGYERWMESDTVTISSDPLIALRDALVATIYGQIRRPTEPVLTINIPNTELWKGMNVHGMDMSGRRWKDFSRPVSPYIQEFSVFTPAKVQVVQL